jgi:hypothetical protein
LNRAPFFSSLFFLCYFCFPPLGVKTALAEDYTSGNFIIKDPVLNAGTYGTSASFQLFGSLGELSLGTTSAATFSTLSGFLGYPLVTTPAISATAGDGQVSLSWTVSEGFLGFTVSGYQVGRSTTDGGPYTYTSVGNVTSALISSLSNGTTYYFVVRALDAFSNVIATSTQVSSAPTNGSSGGGGGGGGTISTGSAVTFSGRAYPLSKVSVLKDGQIAVTTIAGPDARFSVVLSGLNAGSYNFALYGEDSSNRRSALFTFPTTLSANSQAIISGIFITPTLAADKVEVKRGDNLALFGQTTPESQVTIQVNSETELFLRSTTGTDGAYLYNLDSSLLEYGNHQAKAKSTVASEISSFGTAAGFIVGTQNRVADQTATACANLRGNINNDCKVNLVDFSVLAYWYKRTNPPANIDLNGDHLINLVDFSILIFNWTG